MWALSLGGEGKFGVEKVLTTLNHVLGHAIGQMFSKTAASQAQRVPKGDACQVLCGVKGLWGRPNSENIF